MTLTSQRTVHAAQRRSSEAEASYRAALVAKPDKVTALLNKLARLLAQEIRELEEAERLIRLVITLGAEPRGVWGHAGAFPQPALKGGGDPALQSKAKGKLV